VGESKRGLAASHIPGLYSFSSASKIVAEVQGLAIYRMRRVHLSSALILIALYSMAADHSG